MLFLGIFDISGVSPSMDEIQQLRGAISRRVGDKIQVIAREGFACVTVQDAALSGCIAWRNDEREIAMVSGRAYLKEDAGHDADSVLKCLSSGDYEELAKTRGSFSSWRVDFQSGVIKFCTDKVGVYPIYIARVRNRIYFSSALRMLNALPDVCGSLDTTGLFTVLALGYPIGTQTVYDNVERMYGGQIVEVKTGESKINRVQYWSWDKLKLIEYEPVQLEALIYNKFLDAVKIRLEGTSGDLCFLSGGLDSRCIVGALTELNRRIWSLNFAPEGSQDHLFGRLLSENLGGIHFERSLTEGGFPQRQRTILDLWAGVNSDVVKNGVNSNRVWSGDGGSVGVGHVYLDVNFINLLRNGCIESACDYFLQAGKKVVPRGMLRRKYKSLAKEAPRLRMREELESFNCDDPARAGFLFLLMNDQRQHLTEYFENLDLYRFELVLPFFDAGLLELIISAPVDNFLGHKFYNRWLHYFPTGIADVPWQAYPGHQPCPIPTDHYGSLRYQWKDDWFDASDIEKRLQSSIVGWHLMLENGSLPKEIVDLRKLRVALWLTRMNVRDYRYVLNTAQKMSDFLTA